MLLLIQRRRSSALQLENEIKIRSMLKLEKKNSENSSFIQLGNIYLPHAAAYLLMYSYRKLKTSA